jgi:hypothetical protein
MRKSKKIDVILFDCDAIYLWNLIHSRAENEPVRAILSPRGLADACINYAVEQLFTISSTTRGFFFNTLISYQVCTVYNSDI